MTDEERLKSVDITDENSDRDEVLWAIDYLLNLPVDDDLPLFA